MYTSHPSLAHNNGGGFLDALTVVEDLDEVEEVVGGGKVPLYLQKSTKSLQQSRYVTQFGKHWQGAFGLYTSHPSLAHNNGGGFLDALTVVEDLDEVEEVVGGEKVPLYLQKFTKSLQQSRYVTQFGKHWQGAFGLYTSHPSLAHNNGGGFLDALTVVEDLDEVEEVVGGGKVPLYLQKSTKSLQQSRYVTQFGKHWQGAFGLYTSHPSLAHNNGGGFLDALTAVEDLDEVEEVVGGEKVPLYLQKFTKSLQQSRYVTQFGKHWQGAFGLYTSHPSLAHNNGGGFLDALTVVEDLDEVEEVVGGEKVPLYLQKFTKSLQQSRYVTQFGKHWQGASGLYTSHPSLAHNNGGGFVEARVTNTVVALSVVGRDGVVGPGVGAHIETSMSGQQSSATEQRESH